MDDTINPLHAPVSISEIECAELERFAKFLATSAAHHVRTRRVEFGGDFAGVTQTKSSDVDPVTVVDKESEQLIRRLVAGLRPGDVVLGEEATDGDSGHSTKPGQVRWIVDPIDGTVNFMYGIAAYAVSVACEIDGRIVAGAVADIPHSRVYHAAAGCGAHVEEADGSRRQLRCSMPAGVAVSLLATGFSYDASRRRQQGALIAELLPRVRDIRRMGSAALDLCALADGAVDCYVEHGLNPWDWAAGALIATEAGADVRTPRLDAESRQGVAVIASAASVSQEFHATLDDVGAKAAMPV